MIDLKDFLVYFVLSLLTFSGIYLSADENFKGYFTYNLLPSFTNSTRTEIGTYYKTLNSTHCIERMKNAGGEIEVIVSPRYLKIYISQLNETTLIEVENLKTKISIKQINVSCEKIEDENGWIVMAKNRYGTLRFGIVNASYYEDVDGMIDKLDWWTIGNQCKRILENKFYSLGNIINVSSCFSRQRIE